MVAQVLCNKGPTWVHNLLKSGLSSRCNTPLNHQRMTKVISPFKSDHAESHCVLQSTLVQSHP